MPKLKLASGLFASFLVYSFATAQVPDTTKNTLNTAQPVTVAPAGTQPTLKNTEIPIVTGIRIVNKHLHTDTVNNGKIRDTLFALPGNTIQFTVLHPQAFLKTRPDDKARVTLFVNGREMRGIVSSWGSTVTNLQIQQNMAPYMGDQVNIQLELVRVPASQKSWNYLYNSIDNFYDYYNTPDEVSVGWSNMSPLEVRGNVPVLQIAFFKFWTIYVWAGLFVVLVVGFISLACFSDVIRENAHGAYSLAFTQLLFWTTLVMGAFIYILFFSEITEAFNSSVLLLMGISMSTTGAASFIDYQKTKNQKATPKKHRNFIYDLLTDGTTWSVQRVQTFGWNLILGLYFIFFVIDNKTMPEFSSTLLFLAGFSSTAYILAKLPENTATPPKEVSGDAKTDDKKGNS